MKLLEIKTRSAGPYLTVEEAFGKQPDVYEGDFTCSGKMIGSLKGCPRVVTGTFNCSSNPIKSLEGCPQIVHGQFRCNGTDIRSLHNIHKFLKSNKSFVCYNTVSHVLGLLLVEELIEVELQDQTVDKIINKYLTTNRDIHACQQELIDAGLVEYAKL